jgi:hypothetical protein
MQDQSQFDANGNSSTKPADEVSLFNNLLDTLLSVRGDDIHAHLGTLKKEKRTKPTTIPLRPAEDSV